MIEVRSSSLAGGAGVSLFLSDFLAAVALGSAAGAGWAAGGTGGVDDLGTSPGKSSGGMLSSGSGSSRSAARADRGVGSGVVTVVLVALSVRRRAMRAPESGPRV